MSTSTNKLTAALLRAIRGVDYVAGGDDFRDDPAKIVDDGLRALLGAGMTVDEICNDTQFEREPVAALAAEKPAEASVAGNAPLVFFEAYACSDDSDGPLYATVRADSGLRERLLELQALCKDRGLSEAREGRGCNWGPGDVEDELRLQTHELVVAGDEFWFRAEPKHMDYHVETRGQPIAAFVAQTQDYDGTEPLTFGYYNSEQWQEHLSDYAQAATSADDEQSPGGMQP